MPIIESKEDIFAIIDKFERSKLNEIEINTKDSIKISMKKYPPVPQIFPQAVPLQGQNQNTQDDTPNLHLTTDIPTNPMPVEVKAEEKPGRVVKAPLIGVYYSAPSPDSPPFADIGKKISKGSILCIIEAMKVMNEIESEVDGEITEIFVKNGEPVEFGQPLFRIESF